MNMKIHLTSTIVIPGLESDPAVLPEEVRTLRDLLVHIGGKLHFDLIDGETGNLGDDLEIMINGKEIWFYPKGLNTRLEENDSVEIHMVPLGGG
ncbi:MAG: hypothetical protein ABII06_12285 [Pseudomonadota bacterium]